MKIIKKISQRRHKSMGRLVQNHSTHIEGLIKWLKKIAENHDIKTVTPAALSKTNGRGEKLVIKVTIKTKEGFKLLARKGKLVQEIFLVTRLNETAIKEIIKKTNPFVSRKKGSC
tara:strand:+ start:164 stop:508 length:345 start_codon:yes stop_codon:yes gene_type:complete